MAFQGVGALPALQIDTGLLSSATPINAYRLGTQDRAVQDQSDLMKSVGKVASTGNYLDAAKTAMAGGDVKTGMDISGWDADRRLKAVQFLQSGAERADTPERWNALINTAENAFGSDLVNNYRDFKSRPSALTALQSAQLKMQQARESREAQEFSARLPLIAAQTKLYEANADAATKKTDFEDKEVDGNLVRVNRKTGEVQELYRGQPKVRNMSVTDIGKLSDEGNKFSNLSGFVTDFNDNYAGYTPGIGDVAMAAGRYGYGGKDNTQAADWWQQYDRYKNTVRHELFGGALTPNETQQFEKADINPTMDPALIRKNLARQQEISKKGVARKAQALISAGYDPQVVGEAYGVNLKELGVDTEARRSGVILPATSATKVPSDQSGSALDQARDAISKGAPRDAVIQRLRENGIDPTGL